MTERSKVLIIREKLQRILYGFESAALIPAAAHAVFHRGLHRILQPASLMGIIDPGIDDISVLILLDRVGDISPLVFSPPGEGEGGEGTGINAFAEKTTEAV